MSGNNLSRYLPSLLVTLALLSLAGWGTWKGYSYYQNKKASFYKAYAELPAFDEEGALRTIAAKYGWEYPLPPATLTAEEFEKHFQERLKDEADEVYSPEAFTEQARKIINNYKMAVPGQEVKFQIEPVNDWVIGIYRGMTANDIVQVSVNDKLRNYQYSRISEHFRYLFDKTSSETMARERIKRLQGLYDDIRDAQKKKVAPEVSREMMSLGYYRDENGKIYSAEEIVAQDLAAAEDAYKKKRKAKIHDLVEKYTVWGFMQFEPPREAAPEEDGDSGGENEQ